MDNPIRYDDPEGDCADCPPDITVGGLLETAFYDTKHALFNVAAYGMQLATGSEGRYVADYQTDGSGTPIFGTDYQYVTNETQGQKALSLLGDALQVTSLANGGLSSMAMVETPNQSKQTVEAVKTYQTYTKTNTKTGEVYSGKTSGTKSPKENVAQRDRSPDHKAKNAEGYGPAKLDKTSTNADAIRGREQHNIDKNGGAKSEGGTSGNKIRGVAVKNPKAEQYRKAMEAQNWPH